MYRIEYAYKFTLKDLSTKIRFIAENRIISLNWLNVSLSHKTKIR